jgi:hypothetical protein
MHQDYDLDPKYVIFAKVISGMEVVDALAYTPVTMGGDGGMSQPITPPKILKSHDSSPRTKLLMSVPGSGLVPVPGFVRVLGSFPGLVSD